MLFPPLFSSGLHPSSLLRMKSFGWRACGLNFFMLASGSQSLFAQSSNNPPWFSFHIWPGGLVSTLACSQITLVSLNVNITQWLRHNIGAGKA